MSWRSLRALVSFVALTVTTVSAEPYWVAWEGDTYPEQNGWERTTHGGGAERSFDGGALVLDGRASTDVSDFYKWFRSVEPASGEHFLLEWRLRVDEVYGFADPGLSVTAVGNVSLAFVYQDDALYSLFEGVWLDCPSGSYHEFALSSPDLVTYTLWMDGEVAHIGQFASGGWESGVAWGDYVQGGRSLARWDYVRFGIVPEPACGILIGLSVPLVVCLRSLRSRRTGHAKSRVCGNCFGGMRMV